MVFSADETTDIGYESGTTVSLDDTAHGSRFTGKINWVQLALGTTSTTTTTRGTTLHRHGEAVIRRARPDTTTGRGTHGPVHR
jgi:hypothetical protein